MKRFSPRVHMTALAMFALFLATCPLSAQTENVVYRFNPTVSGSGLNPQSGLVTDKHGNLYGTTYQGGTADWGTVYELTPPVVAGGAWTQTVLHNFTNNADGATPIGAMTFDKSGNLFGATVYGGIGVSGNSNGTIFELTPASGGGWNYAVIANFDNPTVAINPVGPLVIDASGNLYGVSSGGYNIFTTCGGPCGNVFEISPPAVSGGAWTGASIYDFTSSGSTDGYSPTGIIFGPGGAIYGTTGYGGTNTSGTFYKLIPPATSGGAWTEKILFNFPNATGSPYGFLAPGGNGTYYGLAASGTSHAGSVYQLVPPTTSGGWKQTVIYNFTGGSDGSSPNSAVLLDASGNLYGVATGGGIFNNGQCVASGCGTVFKLNPPAVSGGSWAETTLHEFTGGHDGGNPVGRPIIVHGNLFGSTAYGGTPNAGLGGTVYRIVP